MPSSHDVYRLYCRERFPPPSPKQMQDFERSLGVPLPEEFKTHLLEFNGGYFEDAWINFPAPLQIQWRDGLATRECDSLNALFGFNSPHDFSNITGPDKLLFSVENEPASMLVIGNCPMGDQLLLDLTSESYGAIYYTGFSDPGCFLIADNLPAFFELIGPIPE